MENVQSTFCCKYTFANSGESTGYVLFSVRIHCELHVLDATENDEGVRGSLKEMLENDSFSLSIVIR